MKVLREKHILRKAMADLLPPLIRKRPKQPYRAPDALSFVGANETAAVQASLSATSIGYAGYFNARAVEKLRQKCSTAATVGFRDNVAFVGILSTQFWHETFVTRSSRPNRNAA
jgi:asparagine synthase (glutamine-hydrolysing)